MVLQSFPCSFLLPFLFLVAVKPSVKSLEASRQARGPTSSRSGSFSKSRDTCSVAVTYSGQKAEVTSRRATSIDRRSASSASIQLAAQPNPMLCPTAPNPSSESCHEVKLANLRWWFQAKPCNTIDFLQCDLETS